MRWHSGVLTPTSSGVVTVRRPLPCGIGRSVKVDRRWRHVARRFIRHLRYLVPAVHQWPWDVPHGSPLHPSMEFVVPRQCLASSRPSFERAC